MSKKIIAMIIVISVFFISNASSISQKKIDINEAIKLAIKNNSDIRQSTYDISQAEAIVRETKGNALPSLDLSASYTYTIKGQQIPFPDFGAMLNNSTYDILFNEGIIPEDDSKFLPMGNVMMSMQQKNNYSATLQLTQIIFNSAVFTGIGVSKDYLDLSRIQYNAKVSDVILRVKNAFNAVLLTQELLDITTASYKNAQDNLNNVRALKAEGLVSEFDALDAEVRVENIKPQIRQIQNTVTSAKDGLKILIGIPQPDELDVVGELTYGSETLPSLDQYSAEAEKHNFGLQMLHQANILNKANVDVVRSEYYPSLAGFANYGLTGMGDSFSAFTNYSTSMLGISLSMNLFKGNQTKNKVEQAQIDIYKTDEQIKTLKDAIYMQIKSNINELARIKEDIDAQERNINVAERAHDMAVVRYKEGTGSQLEILNSEVALRRAKTNRLQSVYDYIIAKCNLDNLLGRVDKDLIIDIE